MRLKKFALLGAVLLVFVAFTASSAIAESWGINGVVTQVGSVDNSVWVKVKDINGNDWAGPVTTGQEGEILDTALVAFVEGSTVFATWETVGSEWSSLFMYFIPQP
jgi:hypothetical protein